VIIDLPQPALVLLIGPSGSGKTTFARAHFRPTEVLSSDAFRAMIADDENAQEATTDAFNALRYTAARRLQRGRLTVVDATNLELEVRAPFLDLGTRFGVPVIAIVFDLAASVCVERNRRHRQLKAEVIGRQQAQLRRSRTQIELEGFAAVHMLGSEDEVAAAVVTVGQREL
jgi:protein phosphatase